VTDFADLVLRKLASMTRRQGRINQETLRHMLGLASSYLVTDVSTSATDGVQTWATGFHRLVDVLVALHALDELELATVDAASKACSECWSVAGSFRGLDECRECVREVAAKLKTLLDPNGRTYKGERVYAP
jgi:hypothetical protein